MASDKEYDIIAQKKRFLEFHNRAEKQCTWVYSQFLTPAEQSILLESGPALLPYEFHGGFEIAERRIACFGSEDSCWSPVSPPICCLKISAKSAKYAGRMGHRDFLGSVLGLGIKRETTGDIVIDGSTGWIMCLETIAPYIITGLENVGNTPVNVEYSQIPDVVLNVPPAQTIAAASNRVDALCAAVYNKSRAEINDALNAGLIYVDSRQITDPSKKVAPGALVNLRGSGRFRYVGDGGNTRSGRLRVIVEIYK